MAEDFSAEAAAASLARLSREQVAGFKTAAHAASRELSFATEAAVADGILDRLLG